MAAKISFIIAIFLVLLLWCSLCSCDDKDSTTASSSLSNSESLKMDGRDFWVFNFLWNILGYATIILPFALLIRMVKHSNFKERGGSLMDFLYLILLINKLIKDICYSIE